MNIYHADYDEFFSIKHDPEIRSQWLTNSKLCEEPITQLIMRYGIQSKKVLSVGPSYGHEEYWFYNKGGCPLTFVDIDEGHTIENYLKEISLTAKDKAENLLTYGIGDVKAFSLGNVPKFDVCYFSSFTPDMLKDREIAVRIPKSLVRKAFSRLSRKTDDSYSGGPWPENEVPFSELTVKVLLNGLRDDGGLLVYQSYGSYIDARTPGYVPAIRKQLLSVGIFMLDLYYFVGYPTVHLFVGFKGSEPNMKDYLKEIEKKPELTRIHGRAQIEFRGLAKLYDIRRER